MSELANVNTEWKDKKELIRQKFAQDLDDLEFQLFIYQAERLGLNPLLREIWAVKYGDRPAQIFVGRDGHLTIAHKSGQFDGMETEIREVPKGFIVRYTDKKTKQTYEKKFDTQFVSTTTVWRKDMSHSIKHTVFEEEYSTGRDLWENKRRTMIQKVSETQCLRRSFNINGVYSPEEFDRELVEVDAKIIQEPEELPRKLDKELQEKSSDHENDLMNEFLSPEPEQALLSDAAEPSDADETAVDFQGDFPIEADMITKPQLKKLWIIVNEIATARKTDREKVEETIKRKLGINSFNDLSKKEASKVIDKLDKELKKMATSV